MTLHNGSTSATSGQDHSSAASAVLVQQVEDLLAMLAPCPERDAHYCRVVIGADICQHSPRLKLQVALELVEQLVVRLVRVRDRQTELAFGRGERGMCIVDDDDTQLRNVSAVASHAEHRTAVDQLLEGRHEGGLASPERRVAEVVRHR